MFMSNEAKCSCQFCSCRIAFDASMAGQVVTCPSCGLETTLFIPPSETKANTPAAPKKTLSKPTVGIIEIQRGINPLGVASLVLGIIACLFCWIPFLGLVVIPVGGIGCVLAVVGLVISRTNKKTGYIWPVGGLVTCLLSIGLSFLISVGTVAGLSDIQNFQKWTTDSQADCEGVRVFIIDSKVGKLDDGVDAPYINYFRVELEVANLSKTQKIDFRTWRAGEFFSTDGAATLTDNFGNVYKQVQLNSPYPDAIMITDGQRGTRFNDQKTLYPDRAADSTADEFLFRAADSTALDFLVFEKPVPNIKWLHLKLPAKNFGGRGAVGFEIPASKIPNLGI